MEIDTQTLRAAAAAIEEVSVAAKGHGAAIAKLSDDQATLTAQLLELEQKAAKKVHGDPGSGRSGIDLSPVTASASFEHFRARAIDRTERVALPLSVKSLVNAGTAGASTDSDFPTAVERAPGVHGFALRPLRLLDVLPSRPVQSNRIEHVQLAFTGDADVQAQEGDEKASMDFDGQLVVANVATIAVHTTVSAQVLDDNATLQSELTRIMRHSLLSKAEEQLFVGSGTGSFIHGLYTQAPAIVTTEAGSPERIGEALTALEILGHTPDAIAMNPLDWFSISVLKDSEGRFLYGSPASPARPTLWNRPVITSPTIPEGTALIGDTSKANVLDRMQATVFLSRDHLDYRTRNLLLILVEMRIGLELFDVASWRKVNLAGS